MVARLGLRPAHKVLAELSPCDWRRRLRAGVLQGLLSLVLQRNAVHKVVSVSPAHVCP